MVGSPLAFVVMTSTIDTPLVGDQQELYGQSYGSLEDDCQRLCVGKDVEEEEEDSEQTKT